MSRASGYEILQKGVDNMITGQIIQTSIDELKAITKVDLGVYDLNGSEVASTMAVSYTHLDVYKRQTMYCTKCLLKTMAT